jgi:predicted RNA-binding Zn ribbon-like protein
MRRNTTTGSLLVSRLGREAFSVPRYDIPKAAPEPLRQVQRLLNSVDLEHERDWLPEWLAEHELEGELERARALREGLRALVLANNGVPLEADALAVVNAAASRLAVVVSADGSPRVETDGDALDRVLAIAFDAMLDGSWARLKACRNCRWSFYDYSPNRSATWCSMQLCGNRRKTRAYRSRRRTAR